MKGGDRGVTGLWFGVHADEPPDIGPDGPRAMFPNYLTAVLWARGVYPQGYRVLPVRAVVTVITRATEVPF